MIGAAPLPRAVRVAVPQEAIDDYRGGLTGQEAAEKHGISLFVLYQRLRALGLSRGRGRPRTKTGVIDTSRAAAMSARYLAGETHEAIAKDYGISRERVRQVLRKAGTPSLGHRPRKARPFTDAERLAVRLYSEGIAPRDIQARTGVTTNRLGDVRRAMGVEAKPTGTFQVRHDDAEITAKVARLYLSGLRAREIVRQVPQLKFPETVYRYLKKAGVKPRYEFGPHPRLKRAEG